MLKVNKYIKETHISLKFCRNKKMSKNNNNKGEEQDNWKKNKDRIKSKIK